MSKESDLAALHSSLEVVPFKKVAEAIYELGVLAPEHAKDMQQQIDFELKANKDAVAGAGALPLPAKSPLSDSVMAAIREANENSMKSPNPAQAQDHLTDVVAGFINVPKEKIAANLADARDGKLAEDNSRTGIFSHDNGMQNNGKALQDRAYGELAAATLPHMEEMVRRTAAAITKDDPNAISRSEIGVGEKAPILSQEQSLKLVAATDGLDHKDAIRVLAVNVPDRAEDIIHQSIALKAAQKVGDQAGVKAHSDALALSVTLAAEDYSRTHRNDAGTIKALSEVTGQSIEETTQKLHAAVASTMDAKAAERTLNADSGQRGTRGEIYNPTDPAIEARIEQDRKAHDSAIADLTRSASNRLLAATVPAAAGAPDASVDKATHREGKYIVLSKEDQEKVKAYAASHGVTDLGKALSDMTIEYGKKAGIENPDVLKALPFFKKDGSYATPDAPVPSNPEPSQAKPETVTYGKGTNTYVTEIAVNGGEAIKAEQLQKALRQLGADIGNHGADGVDNKAGKDTLAGFNSKAAELGLKPVTEMGQLVLTGEQVKKITELAARYDHDHPAKGVAVGNPSADAGKASSAATQATVSDADKKAAEAAAHPAIQDGKGHIYTMDAAAFKGQNTKSVQFAVELTGGANGEMIGAKEFAERAAFVTAVYNEITPTGGRGAHRLTNQDEILATMAARATADPKLADRLANGMAEDHRNEVNKLLAVMVPAGGFKEPPLDALKGGKAEHDAIIAYQQQKHLTPSGAFDDKTRAQISQDMAGIHSANAPGSWFRDENKVAGDLATAFVAQAAAEAQQKARETAYAAAHPAATAVANATPERHVDPSMPTYQKVSLSGNNAVGRTMHGGAGTPPATDQREPSNIDQNVKMAALAAVTGNVDLAKGSPDAKLAAARDFQKAHGHADGNGVLDAKDMAALTAELEAKYKTQNPGKPSADLATEAQVVLAASQTPAVYQVTLKGPSRP